MTEIEYAKLVARNLRRIAYENGKTQADIARDLHISKATISSWMNGTRVPRMENIDLLCHYFNCKRIDIMEEEQPEYYENAETAALAQELLDTPEQRILLSASRKLTPDKVKLLITMAEAMKETNPDG